MALSARQLVLILAVLLVGWVGPIRAADEDADRQFAFSVRLMQQNETRLALESFAEFVRLYGQDARVPDVHYYMALLQRRLGDLASSARHLNLVTRPLHVSSEALSILRGQVMLESRQPRAAVAALEQVNRAKLKDAETRALWAYLLGVAYRGAGNLPAAEKHLDLASEAGSSVRGQALLELGKTRMQLKQTAAAVDALLAASRMDLGPEGAAEARTLAAQVAYEQKEYEKSADLYRQVVERHQASGFFRAALLGLVRSLYAAGQADELVRQYSALEKTMPAQVRAEALYLVGATHVRAKRFEPGAEALGAWLERYGTENPQAGRVAVLYAECLYHSEPTAFEKWMTDFGPRLQRSPAYHRLQFLRAQAAIAGKKPDLAIGHLTAIIQGKDHPYAQRALLQRAALYEQAGRRDEAAVDYSAYAQRYGQNPQAVEAGRRAIDLAFGNRKFAEVVELARPWLKHQAGPPAVRHGVRLKLAVALIKLGQNEQALAELATLLASKPGADLATLGEYYRGLLLAGDAKQGDAAIRALEAALRGQLAAEQVVEATALIAHLHRMAGRGDAAVQTYQKLRKLAPDRPIPTLTQLWVGRNLYESGDIQGATPWLADVLADREASSAVLSEALFLTARCYQDLGSYTQAVETYQRLVAFSAGYVDQGRLGLAQTLAALGKIDSALIEYDSLLQVRGSEVKATALLESAGLQADLAARYEKAGNAPAAEAQWAQALGRLKRVTLLHDLPELEPVVLRALMMLGRISRERGDAERARLHYQRIIKRAGKTGWHEAAASELHLLDGRRGDAIVSLRRLASGDGDRLVIAHARRRLEQLGEKP